MILNIIIQGFIQLITILRDAYLIKTDISSIYFVIKTTAIMGFVSAVLLDWAIVMNIQIPKLLRNLSILISLSLLFFNNLNHYLREELLVVACILISISNVILYAAATQGLTLIQKRLVTLLSVCIVNFSVFFALFELAWLNTLIIASLFPLLIAMLPNSGWMTRDNIPDDLNITAKVVLLKTMVVWSLLGFILFKSSSISSPSQAIAVRMVSYLSTFVMVLYPLLWRLKHDSIIKYLNITLLITSSIFLLVFYIQNLMPLLEVIQYLLIVALFIYSYTKLLVNFGLR